MQSIWFVFWGVSAFSGFFGLQIFGFLGSLACGLSRHGCFCLSVGFGGLRYRGTLGLDGFPGFPGVWWSALGGGVLALRVW